MEQSSWASAPQTIAALTVTGILVVGQMYIVIPLFAPMSKSFGAAPASMTWLATIFGFAYAGGFLLAGPLADRYGSRPVIVLGLLATSVTTAAVATAPNLGVGCALRALQGFTAASFAPAAFAYVAEHLAPNRRSLALTCITSGYLAAAVLVQVAAQGLNALAGWRSAFLVFAPALVVAALAAKLVLRPRREVPQAEVGSIFTAFAAMPRLLARPRLLGLYGATMTVLGGFVAVYTGISLAGPAGIVGHPAALLALRASALPAMIAVPAFAPLLARLSTRTRLVLGLAAAAAAALVASLLGSAIAALAAVLLVLVAGVAIAAPALVEAISQAAADARGSAVALYAFSMFIGASLGPQLAGDLTGSGFTRILQLVVGIFAVGALLAACSVRRDTATKA
ncbi:MFS transporter [Kitasatospora kifunensis]|uniref:MFS family permease n=1 Tax=Kitasatospora kifunensis TaxID=58351 RepID=A0A7W7QZI6_KITKI|nr:MFS transporter [Kitasatospora kifunensis]MBB4922001.1 MFS family permease [Kitasatospora kifunensis]